MYRKPEEVTPVLDGTRVNVTSIRVRITSFFFTFFPYRHPYLSFRLRIDQLRFQAGCRERRLNQSLVFLCFFCEF